MAVERTANRWCGPPSSAAALRSRATVWSQLAAAAAVTTTPPGTGKPAPARRARLAALVPSRACAWVGSRWAASARLTTAGSVSGSTWWARVWVGGGSAIMPAPVRSTWAAGGGRRRGHGPQQPDQLVHDLQWQGQPMASAGLGLGEACMSRCITIRPARACIAKTGSIRRRWPAAICWSR